MYIKSLSSEDYRASHIRRLLNGKDQFNGGAGESIGTPAKQLVGHLDGVSIHGNNRGGIHRVNHYINGDAVKCLANAFDKHTDVGFGRLKEQFGRGIVASASSSVDALHPKTRDFNQTDQHTTPPHDCFSRCIYPNLSKH
jgi:hypothetical protein